MPGLEGMKPDGMKAAASGLLNARLVLLVHYQAVEDGENLLAIAINPLQGFAEGHLEIRGAKPLVEHGPRDVDVLTQVLDRMAAEEQAVKKSSLPLRG